MAFPTLYPTGRADLNDSRQRSVELRDYARHLMCYRDGRFGRHPRWRFFLFNILMRRKAGSAARYYLFQNSGLKDMRREKFGEALHADERLLPQIPLKAVLNLDRKEHCLVLTYVGCSRVTNLVGLMFESPFDFERFKPKDSFMAKDRELDMAYRSRQLI